jgi:hypothetical protein
VYVRRLGAVPTGGLIFGLAASGIFLFLCYNLIRGAWTDAPGRRFALGTGWDILPYGFLSHIDADTGKIVAARYIPYKSRDTIFGSHHRRMPMGM